MARKLRKGKVSPLDPSEQIKKREAAERKVARNDAKDKAPPKGKKAKAKAKAKPKAKGTPKVVGGAAALARGGPWTAAAILAAGGITKLLGTGFSYATRGGKPKQADRDLLARQRILSKAIGKQPDSPEMAIQGGIEKKKPVKAQPKVAQKLRPSPESDIMGGSGIPMRKLPKGERAYQAGYETNQPPSVPLASSKKVKATSKSKGSTAGIPNMDVDIEGTLSRYPSALGKTTKKPKAVKKPAPAKTESVAKKKEAVTTTLKGITPPRKPKRGGATKEAKRATKKGLTPTESYLAISTSGSSPEKKGPTVTANINPTGRTIDNVLRGIFSFAGALPQASDIEAPKSRQRKDQEKGFKQFLVK